MKDTSSKKLVRRIQEQDEEAFNELYQKYHRLVHFIAYQIVKNEADADEVVQETFIQVHTSIHSIKDPDLIKAWIGRIAHSKSITLLRKKKDQQMSTKQMDFLNTQKEVRTEFCPDEQIHHDSDMQVLYQCISELSLPYREVLILYYFVQMSIKEMCDVLQIPEGTVKSRLLYAKRNLKEKINRYEHKTGCEVTFHESVLESMLLLASSSIIPKQPNIRFKHITIPTSAILMSAEIALAATCIGSIACFGYAYYQKQHEEPSLPNYAFIQEKDSSQFPSIFYEGKKIENAAEAYEILLTKAHCKAEIEKLNTPQQEEIKKIYETLISFGGVYSQLLSTYGWEDMYQSIKF